MNPMRKLALAAAAAAALAVAPGAAWAGGKGHGHGHGPGPGIHKNHKGFAGHHGAKRHKPHFGHHHKRGKPYFGHRGWPGPKVHPRYRHRLSRHDVVRTLLHAGFVRIHDLRPLGRYWAAKAFHRHGFHRFVFVDTRTGRIAYHH